MPRNLRTLFALTMLIMSASALDATESTFITPKTIILPEIKSEGTSPATTIVDNNVTRQDLITSINKTKDFPDIFWDCPNITGISLECSCDFAHTLRCTGDRTALQVIIKPLKKQFLLEHLKKFLPFQYFITGHW